MAQETIFSKEELSLFFGQILKRAPHYIEIACGCTTKKHGDSYGILKICDDGTIHAVCQCYEGCNKEFDIPLDFAKHGSRTANVPNWRTKIWILDCNGEKIKIENTCLLKYYSGDQYQRPHQEVSHRDVFLSCSACNKVRRFELRTRDACRLYHDAELLEYRTCFDMNPGRWTCNDLEERSSRSNSSGCLKKASCKGCKYCVCLGCEFCRFKDCGCPSCIDFYANALN